MLIRNPRGWELPERAAAAEALFIRRRAVLKGLGLGGGLAGAGLLGGVARASGEGDVAAIAAAPTNPAFADAGRPPTPEDLATTYNNYYEFGSHKTIWRQAQDLPLRPWEVRLDGLLEQPRTIAIDDLIARMPLEERIYRHRCVEAWSMVVPYIGFPLAALVRFARPLGSARYLEMQTFFDPDVAQGQRQSWYPWPYVEGLTMAEATNELAFLATGYYGKPLPPQNGAPLRLAVPWKYGFKHIKAIVRFSFVSERPTTFWSEVDGGEYGFWANVNPEVRHRRWSQAYERDLATDEMIPSRLYNGYEAYVGALYAGLEGEPLFK